MSGKIIAFGGICLSSCCCFMICIGFIGYVYMTTNMFGNNPMCTSSLPGACITTKGLVAHYDASKKSYEKGDEKWKDLSGKKNNATISKECKVEKKKGGWVTGKKADTVKFPEGILKKGSNYTLVHVAKYDGPNGDPRKRIMTASDGNFLSGHWDKRSGVGHQTGISSTWIEQLSDQNSDRQREPIISISQKGSYQMNKKDMKTASDADKAEVPNNLGINIYGSETSDWAIGTILIYDRKLDESEISTIVAVLAEKHSIDLKVDDKDD